MDEERLIVALEARIRDFEKNMLKAERRGTQSYTRLQTGSKSATKAMETDMMRSTTRINQALASTTTKVGAFGKAFAAGAVATGIAAFATSATQAVRSLSEIDQQAKRAGISVTDFQELKYVSEQSRIDVDAMVDGLKELQLRADEFVVTGKGSAAEAFARLGYGASDLKRRLEDPKELFLDIVKRMEDLDKAAQIRVSDEVFGGTGGERFVELLAQGEAGIRGMTNRANELGLVMDAQTIAKAAELDRKFAEVQARVSTLAKTIVVNLAGAIDEALTIDVDDIFGSAERAIAMMGEANYRAMKDASSATEEQRDTVKDLAATYEELFGVIRGATGPDGLRLMDVADVDVAHDLAAILQDLDSEMRAFQNGAQSADEFETEVSQLIGEAKDLLSELDDIDAARFGNVIAQIAAMETALKNATSTANTLRSSLPGDDPANKVYSGRGGDPRIFMDGRTETLAPDKSLRPQLPSVNHSFGVPDPETVTRGGGGGGGRSASASKSDFQKELERTREAVALYEAEATALVAAAASGREYGDAVEYARKRAELMYEAQKGGLEITPELQAEIDQLAAAYAAAGVAADDAADRITQMQEQAKAGAERMSDLFMGIIDGSMDAREALRQLLLEVAKVQLKQAVVGLSEGGGRGFFGAIGKLLGFAEGGFTGSGGKHDPAGIVHAGEFVVKASEVRKPGMRAMLEAINKGLPGFASGGFVSGGYAPGAESGTESVIELEARA